jgi:hypothetical protein
MDCSWCAHMLRRMLAWINITDDQCAPQVESDVGGMEGLGARGIEVEKGRTMQQELWHETNT